MLVESLVMELINSNNCLDILDVIVMIDSGTLSIHYIR